MGIESAPTAATAPTTSRKARNKLGGISLVIAVSGFLAVEFQPWLDLGAVVIFGGLTLKGLLAAFFEASTAGALADWFAVTALFKNPLGIRLKHTDIIAKNKNAIANAVPRFLSGFVSAQAIRKELGGVDFAAKIADFLDEGQAAGEFRDFLRSRAAEFLAAYKDEKGDRASARRAFTARAMGFIAESVDAPKSAAWLLRWAREERFDERVIDILADALREGIGRNRVKLIKILTPILKANSGWQGLFMGQGTVERALAGVQSTLSEIKTDKTNEARRFIVSTLVETGKRLSGEAADISDERGKLSAAFKAALADEGLRDAASGFVGRILAMIGDELASSDGAAIETVERAAGAFVEHLRTDERARRGVNEAVAETIAAIVERCKIVEGLTEYLAALLRSTDERFFVGKIEDAIWNDLQYIRVNGAVVGGLVGLAIALVKAVAA